MHHGERGFFVRSRQLLANGPGAARATRPTPISMRRTSPARATWRAARAAGVNVLLSGGDIELATAAADAGLRVIWRVSFPGRRAATAHGWPGWPWRSLLGLAGWRR